MKLVDRKQALDLMKSTNGKIFSVVFVKKDGTDRKMNCRLGVKKGVKGIGLKFNPSEYDLLTVYDLQKSAFRMISLKTLRAIQINGEIFTIYEKSA